MYWQQTSLDRPSFWLDHSYDTADKTKTCWLNSFNTKWLSSEVQTFSSPRDNGNIFVLLDLHTFCIKNLKVLRIKPVMIGFTSVNLSIAGDFCSIFL